MHSFYLLQALELAKQGKGFCAPNPAVGALIVKNGLIIGQGYHHTAGTAHAEIHALRQAQEEAVGAILYVTLEPCCHYGRTPPCTEAIIASKIKKVYFAYRDPNPQVAGKGQQFLQEQGIPCEYLSLPEIQSFYQSYHYWTLHKKPWIQAKLALTLDGKIAHANGHPALITSQQLKVFTFHHRLRADAILTTINTICQDDPLLNVRLTKTPIAKKIYILDSQLKFPLTAKILKTAQSITLFHAKSANPSKITALITAGIRCQEVPSHHDGLDLHTIITLIGREGVHNLWVEAGSQAFNAFVRERLAHEIYLYLAPKTLGTTAVPAFTEAIDFTQHYPVVKWQIIGKEMIAHFKLTD